MKKVIILFSIIIASLSTMVASSILFFVYYDGPDLKDYDTIKIKSELEDIYHDDSIPSGPVQVDSGYLSSISYSYISKNESSISITVWQLLTQEKGFIFWENVSDGNKYSGSQLAYTKIMDGFYSYYTED